ncbi:MAG: HAD family hydrolase [Syntrophobacteraceae bacterium]
MDNVFRECKAILFDFGGTLDSDGEHWLDRFYELYERSGIEIPRDEIKRVFYLADELCCGDPEVNHLGLRLLMKHHVRLQFSSLKLQNHPKENELVEGFCSKTERILRRNSQILSRIRAKYRLGLVSNFYGNVATLCDEARLSKNLDVILDSIRVGSSKPNPEIFRLALNRLDTCPEETIFVGDSYERDMMPALRLGMKTIWLKGPNPRLPENPEPVDFVISSLAELESLVL